MATISLTVTNAEGPVEGAIVLLGDTSSKGYVTDVNGAIDATVPVDFIVYVPVSVIFGEIRRDYGMHVMKAGEEYSFGI